MFLGLILIIVLVALMSMMALTKPTNKVDMENWEELLKMHCTVMYALGTIDESDIPTDQVEYNALITGQNAKFVTLGENETDPIDISFPRQSDEVSAGAWKGGVKPEGSLKSIALCPDMITLLDSKELAGYVSLLMVPMAQPETFSATTPGLFFAISGVKLIDNAKPNAGGNKSGIDIKVVGPQKKNLSDYLKLSWITDDGVA